MIRLFPALLSLFCLAQIASGELPLKFIPIQKVFQKSLETNNVDLEFSEDDAYLYAWSSDLGGPHAFYLWSLSKNQFIQYGQLAPNELGRQLIDKPDGYRYIQVPNVGRKLYPQFVRNGRIFFITPGSIYTTNLLMKDGRLENRLTGPSGFSYENAVIEVRRKGKSPSTTAFQYDHSGRLTLYFQNAQLPDDAKIRTSADLHHLAVWNQNAITLIDSSDTKPTSHKIAIRLEEYAAKFYLDCFFANNNDWFCLLYRNRDEKEVLIDYYDSSTGRKLGTYSIPKTKYQFMRFEDSIKTDHRGQIVVLPCQGEAMVLNIDKGRFRLLADTTNWPELHGITKRSYALSSDGTKLAFVTDRSEVGERIALIHIADLQSNENAISENLASKPRVREGQALGAFDRGDISVELLRGNEPDSLVHLIHCSQVDPYWFHGFSPDNRWIHAGNSLVDVTRNSIFSLTDFLASSVGIKYFKMLGSNFSPDGRRLVIWSEKYLVFWDLEGATPQPLIIQPFAKVLDQDKDEFKKFNGACFLPTPGAADGVYRLLFKTDSRFRIFGLSGKNISNIASRPIEEMGSGRFSYSSDGQTLYVEGLNRSIKSFAVTGNTFEAQDLIAGPVSEAEKFYWLSSPLRYGVIKDRRDYLFAEFDGKSWSELREMPCKGDFHGATQDNQLILVPHVAKKETTQLAIFDPETNVLLSTRIEGRTGPYIRGYSIASDRKHIAVSDDKRIMILRCPFEQEEKTDPTVTQVILQADAKTRPFPAAPVHIPPIAPSPERMPGMAKLANQYQKEIIAYHGVLEKLSPAMRSLLEDQRLAEVGQATTSASPGLSVEQIADRLLAIHLKSVRKYRRLAEDAMTTDR